MVLRLRAVGPLSGMLCLSDNAGDGGSKTFALRLSYRTNAIG